jgi:Flp pilus assembly CpaF family ATPase
MPFVFIPDVRCIRSNEVEEWGCLTPSATSRGARMLRTALGPAIASFLQDASIVEVMLNPDGRLWIDQAKLNLGYTKIYAPVDGTVANRVVQVGTFVQPGQTLFAAAPSEAYVIANFKETKLEPMKAKQTVRIHVDAFPGKPTQRTCR